MDATVSSLLDAINGPMGWLTSFVALVVVYYSYRWLRFRLKYDMHKLPSPPRLPLIGHLHHFLKMGDKINQNKFIRDWHEKLGRPKIMLKTVPGDTSIVIFDSDFLRNKVLGRDGFPKDKIYDNMNDILLGNKGHPLSMTSRQPSKFSTLIRRAMATSFSQSHIRFSMDKILWVIDRATARMEKEAKDGPVDLQCLFLNMATDIVGKVGFDRDFGGIDKTGVIYAAFVEAFVHFTDNIFKPHLQIYMKLFPNSKPAIRKRTSQENIWNMHAEITDAVLTRPFPSDDEHSLWANIRRLINPETGKPIERQRLVGEVASMVGAAMDTTGHQLAWCFGALSDHPEVVDRLLSDMKEIGIYGSGARELEFADLARLPYLTAIVKECMRMVSSVSILSVRALPEDMEIFGYRLPKGLQVYIPANVYSHMPDYFDDPEAFRPDRWMSNKTYDMYIPFGTGPRDCVGQRLGFLEIQLTMAVLLPRYHIKLSNGYTFKDVVEKQYYESVMVAAKGGMMFDITPRETEV